MEYTGRLVITEMDTNPNSPTFGQTRTTVIESDLCSHKLCDMVRIGDHYDDDGNHLITYADQNEYSPTYNTVVDIIEGNTDQYLLEYYRACEIISYGEVTGNSGNVIISWIDANPNSATYQTISETKEESESCERPYTGVIAEATRSCKIVTYPSGVQGMTGTLDVVVYDRNPYSPTYNTIISRFDSPSDECTVPNTTPYPVELCSYCQLEEGEPTGVRVKYLINANKYSLEYTGEPYTVTVFDEECR